MKIRYLKLKHTKWIVVALLNSFYLIIFVFSRRTSFSEYLLKSLEGTIRYDDPMLLQHIKEKFLEPPSDKPYAISQHLLIKRKLGSERFYEKYVNIIFEKKKEGFFVEAGALDGQAMSNTLDLEMKQGWSGLLVEPDRTSYISLKKKHRKAWSVNACLSIDKFPKQEKFWSRDVTLNSHSFIDAKHRAMDSILQENQIGYKAAEIENIDSTIHYTAQCFPLASLLMALNVTRVDLLSLDVEFVEEQIIRNFPFHKFDVQVIFIEWWDKSTVVWLSNFLKEKGFSFVANIRSDIIFVKKDSHYDEIIKKKIPNRVFTIFEEIPIPQNKTEIRQPKIRLKKEKFA